MLSLCYRKLHFFHSHPNFSLKSWLKSPKWFSFFMIYFLLLTFMLELSISCSHWHYMTGKQNSYFTCLAKQKLINFSQETFVGRPTYLCNLFSKTIQLRFALLVFKCASEVISLYLKIKRPLLSPDIYFARSARIPSRAKTNWLFGLIEFETFCGITIFYTFFN